MRLKIKNISNSGNRKGWSKHVTNVDESKNNGYAFDGYFIPDDTETELPIGAVVIECRPEGSVKNSWKTGYVYKVTEDGLQEMGGNYHWYKEFLSFRDKVVECLGKEENPLSEYKVDDLLSELKNRGWEVYVRKEGIRKCTESV